MTQRLSGVIVRAAQLADSARCQEIAVAAWEPIYASTRRALGTAIFEHLYPDWRAAKAGQIAASFAGHLNWILVACAATDPGREAGQESEREVGTASRAPLRAEAERDTSGDIVGFVTYRLDRDRRVGEIGNNAVDPAWQGRGIAAALYARVLKRFRQHGLLVAKVTTGLDDAHAPARAAYSKAGFGASTASVTLYQAL